MGQELLQSGLRDLLYIVITVGLPIVANYLVKYLQVKRDQAVEATDNALLVGYISDAEEAIEKAVIKTNQTFVDSLKAAGKFDEASAKEAFDLSVKTAKSLITIDVANAIKTVYGDFDTYLEATIETLVNQLK